MVSPTPITDLAGLSARVKEWLPTLVPSLGRTPAAGLELWKDFTGCWRARVRVQHAAVEFTLLRTPAGGILAWPTPMPPRFAESGVPASDGTTWRETDRGQLVLADSSSGARERG
jgi:hypothetical protein